MKLCKRIAELELLEDQRKQVDVEARIKELKKELTECKKVKDDLYNSKVQLQSIIDNTTAVIYLKDLDGRFILINRQFEKLFHIDKEQILGKTDYDIFPQKMADAFRKNDLKVIEAKYPIEFEEIAPHDDDFHSYISLKFPIFDSKNTVYGVCGISTDITERKHLEEQLYQSQKMEAIGRLAGGVAHDFNNLLTVIIGYSELMENYFNEHNMFFSDIKEIRNAAERGASLTRKLLAFSQKQVLQLKVLNLNIVIKDMEKMLRCLIGEDIELVIALDPTLKNVKIDPVQIEQVIMNLIVNARDAMPRGGKLMIETTHVNLEEVFILDQPVIQSGRYVMIAISDTGFGMDKEIQSHIFEPFFTTKEKGTGLGLSIVYRIIKQSRGHIWVSSIGGHGTTFKIYLPLVEDDGESIDSDESISRSLFGSETILLVEDEEVVLNLACSILRQNGYKVLGASNGDRALTLGEQYKNPIHLVISDVIMPGMSGKELVKHIKRIHPETKIIYMSGYTDNTITHYGIEESEVVLLYKPFSPSALLRKIREVIDNPTEEPP